MSTEQHIIFQAYGHEGILTEAVVAVASIKAQLNHEEAVQIHIWTDQAAFFQNYQVCEGVIIHPLDLETITVWSGPKKFVHRVKIKLIEEALSQLVGKIIYLDTDVVIKGSIQQLFDQIGHKHYLMHSAEGTLADSNLPLNRKIGRFLKNRPITINRLGKHETMVIPQTTMMHNAGVIGLVIEEARQLIADVLATSDGLYDAWDRHTMEQLAFSYVLGKGQVIDTTNQVTHYWRLKPLRSKLKQLIDLHKSADASELYGAIMARFDLNQLNAEMTLWELKPSLVRTWKKLTGQDYRLPE